ncbi:MAG: hypothetical protein ACR2RL_19950, partial [Gammaproteobacteria bacterium]
MSVTTMRTLLHSRFRLRAVLACLALLIAVPPILAHSTGAGHGAVPAHEDSAAANPAAADVRLHDLE